MYFNVIRLGKRQFKFDDVVSPKQKTTPIKYIVAFTITDGNNRHALYKLCDKQIVIVI